jgi:hypothetical protein
MFFAKKPNPLHRIPLTYLNDDVLLEICSYLPGWSLKQLSLVNRQLYYLVGSRVLRRICIRYPDRTSRRFNNHSWHAMRRATATLSGNSEILAQITSFKFDIYAEVTGHLRGAFHWMPREQDVKDLAVILAKMPKLRTLTIYLPKVAAEILGKEISRHGDILLLPSVKTLIITEYVFFLVLQCPNATQITLEDPYFWRERAWDHFAKRSDSAMIMLQVKEASPFTRIVRLSCHIHLFAGTTCTFATSFPQLRHLDLRASDELHTVSFKHLIPTVGAKFKNLGVLEVISASMLARDLRNGYSNTEDLEGIEESIAELAFREIKSLSVLWVGYYSMARRTKDGWHWTRDRLRMKKRMDD